VEVCALRLVDEVYSFVKKSTDIKQVSFIGYSFGGIIARFAVGILHDQVNKNYKMRTENKIQRYFETDLIIYFCVQGFFESAGLSPAHFITLATPHLSLPPVTR
jgi:hypothetical protein